MSVNPDIEETYIFQKLAREMIDGCELEDTTYAEEDYYALLFVFSKAIACRTVEEIKRDFPCMVDSMEALDCLYRLFDWPSLAIVVDQLRGRSLINLDIS